MDVLARLKTWARKTGALAPVLRWWRTVVGVGLMLAGIVGLVVPFVSYSVASPDDVLLAGQGTISGPVSAFGSNRLTIPDVGISMPVLTGGEDVLEQGAWLVGAKPGQPGNAVLFGHRFKYLPPLSNTMFRLDGLELGDTFTVRWEDQDLHYRVTEMHVIEPTELWVTGDFGDERVTLITCTPVWSTSHRLVVVGVPVPQE